MQKKILTITYVLGDFKKTSFPFQKERNGKKFPFQKESNVKKPPFYKKTGLKSMQNRAVILLSQYRKQLST